MDLVLEKERLVAFYKANKAEGKLAEVDATIARYGADGPAGIEKMWALLAKKYKTVVPPYSSNSNGAAKQTAPVAAPAASGNNGVDSALERQRLVAFYNTHAPDKLGDIDATVARYCGGGPAEVEKMWKLLAKKYKTEVPPYGAAAPPTASAQASASSNAPSSTPTTAAPQTGAGVDKALERQRLVAFYTAHAPDKLGDVDATVARYCGSGPEEVAKMWALLSKKYKTEVPPYTSSSPAAAAASSSSSGTPSAPAPVPMAAASAANGVDSALERQRLVAFYNTHAPDKLGDIDATVARYCGGGPAEVEKMWKLLAKKYKTEVPPYGTAAGAASTAAGQPSAPAAAAALSTHDLERQRLVAFYTLHAPDKLGDIDATVNRYCGDGPAGVEKMWRLLAKKYNTVVPPYDGANGGGGSFAISMPVGDGGVVAAPSRVIVALEKKRLTEFYRVQSANSGHTNAQALADAEADAAATVDRCAAADSNGTGGGAEGIAAMWAELSARYGAPIPLYYASDLRAHGAASAGPPLPTPPPENAEESGVTFIEEQYETSEPPSSVDASLEMERLSAFYVSVGAQDKLPEVPLSVERYGRDGPAGVAKMWRLLAKKYGTKVPPYYGTRRVAVARPQRSRAEEEAAEMKAMGASNARSNSYASAASNANANGSFAAVDPNPSVSALSRLDFPAEAAAVAAFLLAQPAAHPSDPHGRAAAAEALVSEAALQGLDGIDAMWYAMAREFNTEVPPPQIKNRVLLPLDGAHPQQREGSASRGGYASSSAASPDDDSDEEEEEVYATVHDEYRAKLRMFFMYYDPRRVADVDAMLLDTAHGGRYGEYDPMTGGGAGSGAPLPSSLVSPAGSFRVEKSNKKDKREKSSDREREKEIGKKKGKSKDGGSPTHSYATEVVPTASFAGSMSYRSGAGYTYEEPPQPQPPAAAKLSSLTHDEASFSADQRLAEGRKEAYARSYYADIIHRLEMRYGPMPTRDEYRTLTVFPEFRTVPEEAPVTSVVPRAVPEPLSAVSTAANPYLTASSPSPSLLTATGTPYREEGGDGARDEGGAGAIPQHNGFVSLSRKMFGRSAAPRATAAVDGGGGALPVSRSDSGVVVDPSTEAAYEAMRAEAEAVRGAARQYRKREDNTFAAPPFALFGYRGPDDGPRPVAANWWERSAAEAASASPARSASRQQQQQQQPSNNAENSQRTHSVENILESLCVGRQQSYGFLNPRPASAIPNESRGDSKGRLSAVEYDVGDDGDAYGERGGDVDRIDSAPPQYAALLSADDVSPPPRPTDAATPQASGVRRGGGQAHVGLRHGPPLRPGAEDGDSSLVRPDNQQTLNHHQQQRPVGNADHHHQPSPLAFTHGALYSGDLRAGSRHGLNGPAMAAREAIVASNAGAEYPIGAAASPFRGLRGEAEADSSGRGFGAVLSVDPTDGSLWHDNGLNNGSAAARPSSVVSVPPPAGYRPPAVSATDEVLNRVQLARLAVDGAADVAYARTTSQAPLAPMTPIGGGAIVGGGGGAASTNSANNSANDRIASLIAEVNSANNAPRSGAIAPTNPTATSDNNYSIIVPVIIKLRGAPPYEALQGAQGVQEADRRAFLEAVALDVAAAALLDPSQVEVVDLLPGLFASLKVLLTEPQARRNPLEGLVAKAMAGTAPMRHATFFAQTQLANTVMGYTNGDNNCTAGGVPPASFSPSSVITIETAACFGEFSVKSEEALRSAADPSAIAALFAPNPATTQRAAQLLGAMGGSNSSGDGAFASPSDFSEATQARLRADDPSAAGRFVVELSTNDALRHSGSRNCKQGNAPRHHPSSTIPPPNEVFGGVERVVAPAVAPPAVVVSGVGRAPSGAFGSTEQQQHTAAAAAISRRPSALHPQRQQQQQQQHMTSSPQHLSAPQQNFQRQPSASGAPIVAASARATPLHFSRPASPNNINNGVGYGNAGNNANGLQTIVTSPNAADALAGGGGYRIAVVPPSEPSTSVAATPQPPQQNGVSRHPSVAAGPPLVPPGTWLGPADQQQRRSVSSTGGGGGLLADMLMTSAERGAATVAATNGMAQSLTPSRQASYHGGGGLPLSPQQTGGAVSVAPSYCHYADPAAARTPSAAAAATPNAASGRLRSGGAFTQTITAHNAAVMPRQAMDQQPAFDYEPTLAPPPRGGNTAVAASPYAHPPSSTAFGAAAAAASPAAGPAPRAYQPYQGGGALAYGGDSPYYAPGAGYASGPKPPPGHNYTAAAGQQQHYTHGPPRMAAFSPPSTRMPPSDAYGPGTSGLGDIASLLHRM